MEIDHSRQPTGAASAVIKWLFIIIAATTVGSAGATPWVTGYYPGWEQTSWPASNLDFSTITHVIHFSVVPNTDGTLNATANSISAAGSAATILAAHAAGRAAIICVGGADTESGFLGATGNHMDQFIGSLTNFMATRDYDGIDIDWEPLPSTDGAEFTNLVKRLRTALGAFSPHKLLTVAAGAYPPWNDSPTATYGMYAELQDQFDQINIMTYDLSGPYSGWVTWFNSPLYDGGYRFPSTDGLVPSVDGAVNNFLANGVNAAKLGIGVAFYGYQWTDGSGSSPSSITGPRQSWINAPIANAFGYRDIMADFYRTNAYHWDTNAQAAYLGITNPVPTNNEFISYDDSRTCAAKVSYVRNRALGGLMIWELAQDVPGDQATSLTRALRQSLATPGLAWLNKTADEVNLTFQSSALGSYRIQYCSNPVVANWSTLLVTNVLGGGGPLTVSDPASMTTQPARFYRIQTPP